MNLSNFGAVLSFAAELEAADTRFYQALVDNPALVEYGDIFQRIAAALKKNEKELLRARRENVTEMILEPIHDFDAGPFCTDDSALPAETASAAVAAAVKREEKAVVFYTLAAEKMHALPEVSRLLTRLAKIRTANQAGLNSLPH